MTLRIADGSIMPRVATGNTMAPCIIIGERAAEALRNEHRLEAPSVSRGAKGMSCLFRTCCLGRYWNKTGDEVLIYK
jgi:GMC oxidoreductase